MNQPVEKRIKPTWMAQVDAPQDYVLEFLNREGIGHKVDKLDPKLCKNTQKDVNTEKVKGMQEAMDKNQPLGPVYLSADDEILDGHHRVFAAIRHPEVESVACIKLYLGLQDAMRVLNKCQDIFNFQKDNTPGFAEKYGNLAPGQEGLVKEEDKEPVTPEAETNPIAVSADTKTDNDTDVHLPSEAVPTQKSGSQLVPFESAVQNPQTMTLYSAKGINRKARTGDFLLTQEKPSMKQAFDCAFENILDIKPEAMEGITYPTEAVLQEWLPGQDYAAEAKTQGLPQEIYMSREVNRLALQKGFDGINYGGKLVQIINPIV